MYAKSLYFLVPRPGIELGTRGFSVRLQSIPSIPKDAKVYLRNQALIRLYPKRISTDIWGYVGGVFRHLVTNSDQNIRLGAVE